MGPLEVGTLLVSAAILGLFLWALIGVFRKPTAKEGSSPGWYPTESGERQWWDGHRFVDTGPRPAGVVPRSPEKTLLWSGLACALILPVLGVIIGIVMLAKNYVGPGLAVLVTNFITMAIAFSLFNG